ncbi:hypothetical protein KZZ10_09085 [Alcaligenaceae bacterium LF4-65]|uniref:DUF962 domain-containing protein n=1 Tax=Zwartia hollandica TaxID=324606 RepID=A0A953NAM4_9BURK|nr:hypothetical protein [Zwartia hollandica]MBZ1350798.1 hypothetical protein [Zwartia hollandica]
MKELLKTLSVQRWDDHRYYHHSRINQSLHFVSAISFLVSYVLLFINPVAASFVAWLIAMTTRQSGHFFFEPKGYDHVNQATHAHKEEIKVGYNLHRKIVLLAIWAMIPVVAYFAPQYVTWMVPQAYEDTFLRLVGMSWLMLGVAGLVFRVGQLCIIDSAQAAFAWAIKIITDPFHDIKLYYRSPIYLLRGELIDPMPHIQHSK